MNAKILVVLAAFVGSVACGSSSTPTSPGNATGSATPTPAPTPTAPTLASVAGVWTLATLDGGSLPGVVGRIGGDTLEILSATLTLAANGTFTESGQTRLTRSNGRVETDPIVANGTFTLDGNSIAFAASNGQRRTGTLSGTTLTIAFEGYAYVFRKS